MKNVFLFKNKNRRFFSDKVSKRILKYSDTIISPLKTLKNELEHRDVVFVTQQSQRWTIKELDIHSDAFAYYLMDQGLNGRKILFWSDVNHSLEYISSAIGSLKSGNTIVTSEFENWEDVENVLREVDVLVVSPYVQAEKNKTRIDKIKENIPEMQSMRYGDVFKSIAFPNLKQIIQISHKTIPGTEKFKHCLNYTKNFMTNTTLPNLDNEIIFQIHTHNGIKSINHRESLAAIQEFNSSLGLEFANILNSAPIHYPVNLTLGLLAGFASKSYNIFPGNYNFAESLKLIESQRAQAFIAEDALLDVHIPKEKINEIKQVTSTVKDVVIFSTQESLDKKELSGIKNLFESSNLHFYDEFTFKKL